MPLTHPDPPCHVVKPRILVIEDSVFVVLALEALLEDLGWDMAGPAGTMAEGLHMARTGTFDAALLDVGLHDEMSWDIASALLARGIPFAFATGHDMTGAMPAEFTAVPVLRKPFRIADVELTMQHLLDWPAGQAAS